MYDSNLEDIRTCSGIPGERATTQVSLGLEATTGYLRFKHFTWLSRLPYVPRWILGDQACVWGFLGPAPPTVPGTEQPFRPQHHLGPSAQRWERKGTWARSWGGYEAEDEKGCGGFRKQASCENCTPTLTREHCGSEGTPWAFH